MKLDVKPADAVLGRASPKALPERVKHPCWAFPSGSGGLLDPTLNRLSRKGLFEHIAYYQTHICRHKSKLSPRHQSYDMTSLTNFMSKSRLPVRIHVDLILCK